MGQDGSTTIPGDINVVGKSSLDARSDSGVALYAANDLNFLQLSAAQAPQAVPEVKTAFDSQGITPGSGDTGTGDSGAGNYTEAQVAVYQLLAYTMVKDSVGGTGDRRVVVNSSGTGYDVQESAGATGVAQDLNDQRLTSADLTINGAPKHYDWGSSGVPIGQALYAVLKDLGAAVPTGTNTLTDAEVGNLVIGSSSVYGVPSMRTSGGSGVWASDVTDYGTSGYIAISNTDITSYATSGVPSTQPTPTPTATPSATPSAGATTTEGALDQAFSGLVYAGGDVNMTNKLGRVTVSGAIAAYGGDPNSQQAGTGTGGNINITGADIALEYNPSLLGPYSSFFGGEITLKRNSLTVY
jgi:hypothetical protein